MSTAYFLVAHGSRDPRPQIALEQLAEQLRCSSLKIDSALMGTGILECAALSLSQQLQQFANTIRPHKITQIKILPLFLLPGVHVKEDIPVEVAIAQQILGEEIQLEVLPYIGSKLENMVDILANQKRLFTVDSWILMAHGSRRQGGNYPIELLAEKLDMISAYWSVKPDLSTQITQFIQQGESKIGVLPYFLFTGGITDAIAQLLQDLSQQFSNIEFVLATPLDGTSALKDLTRLSLLNEMQEKITVIESYI